MCKVQHTFKADHQQLTCTLRCVMQDDTCLCIRCHAVLTEALEIATSTIKKYTAPCATVARRKHNFLNMT